MKKNEKGEESIEVSHDVPLVFRGISIFDGEPPLRPQDLAAKYIVTSFLQ